MNFEEGELTGTEPRFYPISISSHESYNDYSPVLLEGEAAEKALRRITKRTGTEFER